MEREPGDRLAPDPWPLPIRIELGETPPGERAGAAERSLRARPGVAVFVAAGDDAAETVSVAACGDLRAFVGGRLRGEGPRADLSEVTTRIQACECGSGFEADLACDAVARGRAPEAAELAAARRAAWFVHLDPRGDVPACRVIDAARAESIAAREGQGSLIGPFARRVHAEAWAAMLEVRFDLCREPSTLALRPDATACPYKAMGACPAPCDGSEPMDAYRERCRAALAFDGSAWRAELDRVEEAIRDASASLDFERAAALKEERETLGRIESRSGVFVRTMDRFEAVAVMPSGRTGWARLFVHAGGRTEPIGDVRAGGDAAVAQSMIDAGLVRTARDGVPDPAWGDAAAIVLGRVRSTRKTRGMILPPSAVSGDDERAIRRDVLGRMIDRASRIEVDPADEPGDEKP